MSEIGNKVYRCCTCLEKLVPYSLGWKHANDYMAGWYTLFSVQDQGMSPYVGDDDCVVRPAIRAYVSHI